jgi:hypothetical protein
MTSSVAQAAAHAMMLPVCMQRKRDSDFSIFSELYMLK